MPCRYHSHAIRLALLPFNCVQYALWLQKQNIFDVLLGYIGTYFILVLCTWGASRAKIRHVAAWFESEIAIIHRIFFFLLCLSPPPVLFDYSLARATLYDYFRKVRMDAWMWLQTPAKGAHTTRRQSPNAGAHERRFKHHMPTLSRWHAPFNDFFKCFNRYRQCILYYRLWQTANHWYCTAHVRHQYGPSQRRLHHGADCFDQH